MGYISSSVALLTTLGFIQFMLLDVDNFKLIPRYVLDFAYVFNITYNYSQTLLTTNSSKNWVYLYISLYRPHKMVSLVLFTNGDFMAEISYFQQTYSFLALTLFIWFIMRKQVQSFIKNKPIPKYLILTVDYLSDVYILDTINKRVILKRDYSPHFGSDDTDYIIFIAILVFVTHVIHYVEQTLRGGFKLSNTIFKNWIQYGIQWMGLAFISVYIQNNFSDLLAAVAPIMKEFGCQVPNLPDFLLLVGVIYQALVALLYSGVLSGDAVQVNNKPIKTTDEPAKPKTNTNEKPQKNSKSQAEAAKQKKNN